MKTKEQILELALEHGETITDSETEREDILFTKEAAIRFFHAAQDDAFEQAAQVCSDRAGLHAARYNQTELGEPARRGLYAAMDTANSLFFAIHAMKSAEKLKQDGA